nr:hypothetical protein C1892_07415 [Pseudomonas sp. MPBD7-1]
MGVIGHWVQILGWILKSSTIVQGAAVFVSTENLVGVGLLAKAPEHSILLQAGPSLSQNLRPLFFCNSQKQLSPAEAGLWEGLRGN